MFDIGFWEICIILLVVLLVVRPHQLPQIIRAIAKVVGKIKQQINAIKKDFIDS